MYWLMKTRINMW